MTRREKARDGGAGDRRVIFDKQMTGLRPDRNGRNSRENRGYTVTEEFHLGERRRADLCATRNGRTILLEIETGRSNVVENIKKSAGHKLVLFFTSNGRHGLYVVIHRSPRGVFILLPPSNTSRPDHQPVTFCVNPLSWVAG